MSVLAAALLAVVTQNQVALRAAPRETAAGQALLWQGEVLELRGERGDWLLVYDYALERPGYLLASQVRRLPLAPEDAPALLAIVRFLRDTPGAEALGISYAAAYLKAVPAGALTAEPLDALGGMAERLAARASKPRPGTRETAVSAHLEVVARQGIVMRSFERATGLQICYDGEVYRRVLAMPTASPAERARAALGLTRHECIDPDLGPAARYELDRWRIGVLDRVPAEGLPAVLATRLHVRRAGVWAALAFEQARRTEPAHGAADRALQELALVDAAELVDDDVADYTEAALRVGATRWAAEPVVGPRGRLRVRTTPGAPGETCVSLYAAPPAPALPVTPSPPVASESAPLVRRCTFGIVWTASASASADGAAFALAVQPLDTWRELWVFRRVDGRWTVDVLPPGSENPELGYIEFAGWVPGGGRLLVARELRTNGHYRRRFELVRLDSLVTVAGASSPDLIRGFRAWQDPAWRAATVALR